MTTCYTENYYLLLLGWFPCFLTEPYQEDTIINAIKNGIDEMISAGFF
jgi:hypothetical protein